jgi:hypothetical protein
VVAVKSSSMTIVSPVTKGWLVFSINQTDLYVPTLSLADLTSGRSEGVLSRADDPCGDVPFWSDLRAWSQWDTVPSTAE